MMRKFITCVALAFSASLIAQAATAQQTARIAYGDLNLANPAQAAAFKARVETAGRTLCRAKQRAGDLSGVTPHACIMDVHREAESQLPRNARKALTIGLRSQAVDLAAK